MTSMNLPDFTDTIAAIATPPGMGAIAVLRLSGPRALGIADGVFRGKRLEHQASHTAHFGRMADESGNTIDEVLVTVFKGPHSYTGEDVVEIGCHGSPYVQQALLERLLREGARLAEPGEFTLRAFRNGRMDLSQAEAVADLIAAESAAAHGVALRQMRGGFSDELKALREQLIHFASLVELELDFGEEDVEFADRDALRSLVTHLRAHIGRLRDSFALGNALKHGVSTVIAGRPNAGKSTLLNALLNEERAIVSDIPGTTRDTVEEVLHIRGVAFRLVDTAGIREAQDQIEALGVERTYAKIRQAALLLYVWDVAGGMTLEDVHRDLGALVGGDGRVGDGHPRDGHPRGAQHDGHPRGAPLHDGRPQGAPLLVLCNKMDRNPYFKTEWLVDPGAEDVHPYLQTDPPAQNIIGLRAEHLVPLSALNGQNIEYLKEKIFDTAIGEGFSTDQTVVTNVRHAEALSRADAALADVLQAMDAGISGDLIAQDIRRALYALGEITGEIGVEELLGNIFGRFCIGK